MANYTEHVPLKGSERAVLTEAKAMGAANPDESLQVTVRLRSRAQAADAKAKNNAATASLKSAVESLLKQRAAERQHLTREQFLVQRGALEEDAQAVEAFAHAYGLSIAHTNIAKASVTLTGTVANFAKAFNVDLMNYESPSGSYRGRTGPVYIPIELDGIVIAVLGLDNRPQARPHFRVHRPAIASHARTTQPAGTFTPVQVAQLYDFPANADGTGQCIAIIELGGGFKPQDIQTYFKNILHMTPPIVIAISVDGAHNKPTGDANGPDAEVMLDIEVAGAVAPKSTLAVYFAPNTDQGFFNAIAAAVHDTKNNPSVISISWGGPESSWTQQSLTEYNTLLEDAATLGLTVCVASGDNGSTDGLTDGLQHVDFPASSPYSLACGGTTLTAANGKYGSEVVWNEMAAQEGAGGGGVSDVFAKPAYQANVNVPVSLNPGNFVGRGVPDVSGNADPITGYDVYVNGQSSVIGGTSAVAPLWAGLTTCINQILGKRVGALSSLVYSQVAPVNGTFRVITSGNNGAFAARQGWDACTGWGTPVGLTIVEALAGKSGRDKARAVGQTGSQRPSAWSASERPMPESSPSPGAPSPIFPRPLERRFDDTAEFKASVTPPGTQPSKDRFVNVGFSPGADAATALKTDVPLACNQDYYFFLEVGRLLAESLEVENPSTLPTEYLPIEARLKVVLFAFKDEIEVLNNDTVGELKQEADGSIVVSHQPVQRPRGIEKDPNLLKRRLFFPVRTPRGAGVYRLRCSIYYEQVLVQSRLISASVVLDPHAFRLSADPTVEHLESDVLGRPRQSRNPLFSEVDYSLTHSISPSHLASIEPHMLSLMLNSNGNGTTEMRFFGDKEFIRTASFDELELQDLINQARGALRRASWGDEETWKKDKSYKYQSGGNREQLEADLIMLAKKGYSFYDKIIGQFENVEVDYRVLAALMREPGRLQIALKESARHFIPAALIYDYPLNNGLVDRDYTICPSFQEAFSSPSPLDEADCFNGRCPTKDDRKVICPSGFWGYRHYLGLPLTLAEAPDAPTKIKWQGSPHLTMAVSTDLDLLVIHENALRTLRSGLKWDYANTCDKTLQLLKDTKPHLVYFYCHGGLDHNEPYIEVGPANGPVIKEAMFRSESIRWNDPRPLVFINGCHTTAVEPKQAMEFAGAFIRKANAAGVIGTEITIFEPLAHTFAKNFLRRFIVDSKPLGESVRNTRLDLLKQGNPLGLVYVPFAIASLCMVEQ